MLNFSGLGFAFAARGSAKVLKTVRSFGSAINSAMEAMGGFGEASAKTGGIIGSLLGGSIGLIIKSMVMLKGVGAVTGGVLTVAFTGAALAAGGLLGILVSMVAVGPKIAKSIMGAMGSIKEMMSSLAFGGMNLTTSLEAEAQQTGVSVRAMGANMGFAGKELDKFVDKATGMSISLKAGADESAKALRGWIEAEKELRALGFENAEQLLRFNRAYGTSADLFRDSSRALRKEMKLSNSGINNVIGSLTELGKQTGDVGGAIGDISKIIPLLSRNLALAGGSMPEQEMLDFVTSITMAGRAFFATSENAEIARDMALQLANTMLDSKEQLAGMFAGTEQDLHSFTTEMAISTGDLTEAFDAMQKGPAGFIQGLASMVQAAKKSGKDSVQGLEFLRGRLAVGLGSPEMAAKLINSFDAMDEATLKSMAIVKNATAGLGKMALEADRVGRTMQESFDFAKETMFNAFRALGRPAAQQWLTDVNKGMKDFKKSLGSLAKDNGPFGQFVKKMSEVSIIGAQGLFPKDVRPMLTIFGTFAESLAPTIDMMEKLGLEFTSVTGLAKISTVGLGLWAAQAKKSQKDGESFGASMVRVGKQWIDSSAEMIQAAADWLATIGKAFAEFDWAGLFGGEGRKSAVNSGIDELLNHVKEKLGGVDWEGIKTNFKTGMNNLWESVASEENKAFVMAKFAAVGEWIKTALISAVESLDWAAIFEKIGAGLFKGIGAMAKGVGKHVAMSIIGADTFFEGMRVDRPGDKEAPKKKTPVILPVTEIRNQTDEIKKCLKDVHDTGDYLFGHSINTFIEHDMTKGAKIVDSKTGEMIKSFEDLSVSARDIFSDMWKGIEYSTNDAVKTIEAIAASLVDELQQIAVMKSEILDSRADSGRYIVPAANEERDRRIRELSGDKAVHEPLWYSGSGGYHDVFIAQTNKLIAAVEGMRFRSLAPEAPPPRAPAPRPFPRTAAPTGGVRIPARTRLGGVVRSD